jgi:hypothetical protein
MSVICVMNVMVNNYSCTGVCLFIWRMYSFVCVIRKSMLEVDCEVDEPNTFEDDPQDTLEQANPSAYSICIQLMHLIMFTFWIYCII